MLSKKILMSFLAGALTVGIFVAPKNNPSISWIPEKSAAFVFQGGARTMNIKFKSKVNLSNVDVFAVPELQAFIKINPQNFINIFAGEEKEIELTFVIPKETPPGIIDGTLHLRIGTKTIAKSLPITINVISPQPAEQKISDFLIQNFGTAKPLIPVDRKFLVATTTVEIADLLNSGSNLPSVFRLGSALFAFNLTVDADVSNAIGDLLVTANNKGIRVQDIIATLPGNRWHRDNPDEPVLPCAGAEAITILPIFVSPITATFCDSNGDSLADFLIVIPDINTHIILKPADAEEIIARNFITAVGITDSAITAIHELTHVLDFRTECGGGREWYTSITEENFVSFSLERLISDIFSVPVKTSTILNTDVNSILQDFPNTQDCLERLDLTRPTPVILNIPANVSTSTISLSWSQNTDRDFASYKIFRSTSPNITTNNTLVATITSTSTLTFTNTNLPSNTTFFYKLFVFDKAGLSADSNEISATTLSAVPQLRILKSIPIEPFPTGIAITPDKTKVLAVSANPFSSPRRGSVSIIDTATNATTTSPIRLSIGSTEQIAVSPDGQRAYVAVHNQVDVLDLTTNSFLTSIPISTGPFPGTSDVKAIAINSKFAYVTNRDSSGSGAVGAVSVIDIDPLSPTFHQVIKTIGPPGFFEPYGLAISPDGSRVYAANRANSTLTVIDAVTNIILGTPIPYELNPSGGVTQVTVSPDGSKVFVVDPGDSRIAIIDPDSRTIDFIPTAGAGLLDIVLNQDGTLALVTAVSPANALLVVDVNTKQILQTIPVPRPGFIVFAGLPNALTYVTGDGPDGRVFVIGEE